jgi:branched-chain amino acid aminotransferase
VKVWLDGEVVESELASVSVFDHGLTVGDGVFETVKVSRGQPFALSRHLERLARSARGLELELPDPSELRVAVARTIEANDLGELARLRITVTGGPSPLGSERGKAGPTLMVAATPIQPLPETTAVVTVPWTRNEYAATAGLKTTSYAENVIMLARARAHGATEALFANTAGNLCEGTGSNVFVALDGDLLTPPLSAGCLAGVTRALVLEWFGAREADLPMSVLADAEEIFLVSTVRDVQAVHRVDGRTLPAPGPLTRKAREAFLARAATAVDP